jgi:hypothetical protein
LNVLMLPPRPYPQWCKKMMVILTTALAVALRAEVEVEVVLQPQHQPHLWEEMTMMN